MLFISFTLHIFFVYFIYAAQYAECIFKTKISVHIYKSKQKYSTKKIKITYLTTFRTNYKNSFKKTAFPGWVLDCTPLKEHYMGFKNNAKNIKLKKESD